VTVIFTGLGQHGFWLNPACLLSAFLLVQLLPLVLVQLLLALFPPPQGAFGPVATLLSTLRDPKKRRPSFRRPPGWCWTWATACSVPVLQHRLTPEAFQVPPHHPLFAGVPGGAGCPATHPLPRAHHQQQGQQDLSTTRNVLIDCTAADPRKTKLVTNNMVTWFSQYCKEPFSVYAMTVVPPGTGPGPDPAIVEQGGAKQQHSGGTATTTTYPDLGSHNITASVPEVNAKF
jgi:hypothetical protein